MIIAGEKKNTIKFKKVFITWSQLKSLQLANGKIVKSVEEQYIRDDIKCGLKNCPTYCNLELQLKSIEGYRQKDQIMSSFQQDDEEPVQKKVDAIFIIDHYFALNHIDFIENCDVLTNVVVPDSILKHLNKKNIQSFHNLKNIIEQDARNFFYFYNENFTGTFLDDNKLQGKGIDKKLCQKMAKIFEWYTNHMNGLTDKNKVYLLTDSITNKRDYQQLLGKGEQKLNGVITMEEFIMMNENEFPELVNYMGFSGENDDDNQDMETNEKNNQEQIYEAHLSFSEMILGIREGKYFQGRLNISRINLDEGTVTIAGLSQELFVKGMISQNRALNGDIVCLEVLPETSWVDYFKNPEPFNILYEEPEQSDLKDIVKNKEVTGKNSQQGFDEEEEEQKQCEQRITLIEKINQSKNKKATAKVRGILKRMNKTYGGSLLNFQDMTQETKSKFQHFIQCSQKASKEQQIEVNHYRVFVPFNCQVPQAIVKSTKLHVLENNRFIVRLNKWSRYSQFPQAQFVKIIGEEGKIDTENAMILHEYNVDTRPFSHKVYNCLPREGKNWQISEAEISKRLDLRHLTVCSVDPIGCKDIDDALHCRVLPNGNYEVGVHIADVTHFVRPNTEIDKEAARRCTTVYLVGKRTDMLPKLLTENLCSIVGGVERLTFSVIWEIDANTYQAKKVEYRKTLIRSKAALDYYTAQKMIDDQNDNTELTQSLRRLLKIATVLKERRNQKGALTLASPEIKFKFEKDNENPTDVTEYQHVDTHFMIEEFMLLANIAVAEKIVMHYPSFAILRRHPSPKIKEVQEFVELLAKYGFEMSVEDSKNFAESLDKASKKNDPAFNKLVRILATRCMHQAVYFCLADFDILEVFHYGLAVKLYTHFTSPIRRYADVLVHRLLAAAIDIQSLTNDMTDKFKMARQCDQMNRKNRMAQHAGQASTQFNTFLYFSQNQSQIHQGIVMKVSKAGIYVMIQGFGIEGFILDSQEQDYSIFLDPDKEEALINQNIRVHAFDHLKVKIVAKSVEFRRQIQLHFIEKIDMGSEIKNKQTNQKKEEEGSEMSLTDAKKRRNKSKQNKDNKKS